MTDDEKRDLVARWWSIWSHGDFERIDEVCVEPFVRHTSIGTERLSLADYKKRLAAAMGLMRGATTRIDDQVVAGNKVWTRATTHGVNMSTDNATVLTWMAVHRIEGDRIAEAWTMAMPGVEWETGARPSTPGRG